MGLKGIVVLLHIICMLKFQVKMKNVKLQKNKVVGMFVFLEVALFVFLFFSLSPFATSISGESVDVKTSLDVGAVFPEVLNVSLNDDIPVTLTPNATTTVMCQALVQDWNNDTDIYLVNATLYDTSVATWDSVDDNNDHYSNSSCAIDLDTQGAFGKEEDDWHALANCSFEVEYYANPGDWNCSVYVEDLTNRSGRGEGAGSIDELLAVGLPESINYGIVNSTEVSEEQNVSVSNMGNVALNLTLDGYSNPLDKDDGYAMNCSKGSYKFIDVEYEKFNLTQANPIVSGLTEFDSLYENLTSVVAPPVREFNLMPRTDDFDSLSADKPTYWRIYVPKGVAGTCEGFIEFGAVNS